ncbi:protein ROH1-like [Mercurialis annua]|uniref:protein ROH1-like n=1 Tax=Mercurialis annua TaxID=3986 RepID=UPI002160704B|nr:protein ROH1-like [Mercurialis annua]
MPATEYQPSNLFGRYSSRRNQVVSMDGNHEQELEDLELFQRHVSDRFNDLLSPPEDGSSGDPLLSISWLRKLVDVFLCCEAEFKAVLIMGRDPSHIAKPPLDRLIPELLERAVKALDICNAVSSGVDSVRQCQKFAEIAVAAFKQKPLGDGQVKRARKALSSLMAAMTFDDKENNHFKSAERTWSFGRRGNSNSNNKERAVGNFRCLSMIVAKNWSASKQIQAMCSNLVAPRGAEPTGLASPVFVMSSVMVFVMWALVAAIPCQERSGLATHFQIPRQLPWAQSMIGLQEKIGEEWKKKEKKGSAGLLEEMQRMEKLSQSLIEFADGFQFSVEAEKEEMNAQVEEMAEICRRMEEGLVPLQMQIREVFHRIVRSRAEVLELLDHSGKISQPIT